MQTYLYRHDEILTARPYGFDVDEEGWLWEGCGTNRLTGHNLDTAECRQIPVPEMGGRPIYESFCWHGKLVMVLGDGPFYLVYDVNSRVATRVEIPATQPITWYGTKTAEDKLILFERSESRAIILDAPDAMPRFVQCPFEGQLAGGSQHSDGLIYSSLSDPNRIITFDPKAEKFIEEFASPFPKAGLSGRHEHEGVIYFADSSGGRLVPFDINQKEWLDPISTPDHGSIYGFIGGSFSFKGKGYFCLSSYAAQSRLDVKTRKIIIPDGPLSVDGKPYRFLDRYLVFEPESQSFEYLVAPEQPDGVPLLCYAWADENRFAITGMMIPYTEPGELGRQHGQWLVMQSEPAKDEPGFQTYDTNFDRKQHLARYRRTYPRTHSVYIVKEPHSPATKNLCGPALRYPPGRQAELIRRAAQTDADKYWNELAMTLTGNCETDAERVQRVGGFIHRQTYYTPNQEPESSDPIVALESHDVCCGNGVNITQKLLEALGIPVRKVGLSHHVVAEAEYDGGWHMIDAKFFGSKQPHREGCVLTVDELKADIYFADAFPQDCFVFDPELVTSEDGFNILGYVFGPWGSEPFYSYYLGAEKEHPPTLPYLLPAERLGKQRVRLNWSRSLKMGGGDIEYELSVFKDRDCKDCVFQTSTTQTSFEYEAPEANWMYYIEVRAKCSHRKKNPDTWYPAARSNFVCVPEDQYGWYGVV
ncbi:MAG: hypothetical protein O3B01_10490 [Planctomycetota bacterium]|nr:hypothetical protein [Planctomycetota bacterium]MDA1138999.1 hypothetical protein [Planctomycetota bacterium]